MRFKQKYTKKDIGKTRNITRFLYFPLKIDDEWRWLEKAIIEQRIVEFDNDDSIEYHWINDKFIN